MKITRIGFGAWAIGGGNWVFGWGPQDDSEAIAAIGLKHGYSAGEVAIAWTLKNPAVTAAIVGGRSAKQVDGICRAAEAAGLGDLGI